MENNNNLNQSVKTVSVNPTPLLYPCTENWKLWVMNWRLWLIRCSAFENFSKIYENDAFYLAMYGM